MYSRHMIGAFCCPVVASILLVVSMATDHWIEVNLLGLSSVHLGPWKIVTSPENRKEDTIAMGFWNSIRFFMIVSVILCILGNLSFAPFFSRINRCCAAGIMFFLSTFCAFLAMAVFTGMKVKYFDQWNYAWGYIMGWIALILTFVAGILTRYAFKGEALSLYSSFIWIVYPNMKIVSSFTHPRVIPNLTFFCRT